MSFTRQSSFKTSFKYYHLLLAALVPVIIYFYFLQWKTGTAYGDDLYIFQYHGSLQHVADKISMPLSFGKYRPVHGMNMHLLIELFQKNIAAYYYFNICIQAINALLFALVAHLFLRSVSLSLLFGLTVGLSRFALFNIVQLLNGGALEGMAMSFFLAALFFMVRSLAGEHRLPTQHRNDLFWSIVFANLAMYTHERYIVLLPFIMLLALLYPGLRKLNGRQKAGLIIFCVASIIVNVLLKKQLYDMPFFMGTASAGMVFSLPSALGFLKEGMLSLFQFNNGPEFLVGIPFTAIPLPEKLLVLLVFAGIVWVLFYYLRQVKQSGNAEQQSQPTHIWLFLSLIILCGLFLVPAVLTIRLEQRWLQASWSIFVLLFIIAATVVPAKQSFKKNGWMLLFCLLLLWVDANYLARGGKYIYLNYSEAAATEFEEAIQQGVIKRGTNNLYIWEKKRDPNTENAIRWDLGDGYFFNFYQQHGKNISFVDSVYKDHHLVDTALAHFNKQTDQVLYIDSNIVDITSHFLQDSLQLFSRQLHAQEGGRHQFFGKQLHVTAANIGQFATTGFYDNENGIRWTNGKAAIEFTDGQALGDSVYAELNTYMPEACKNITPVVAIKGYDEKIYMPVASKREGDVFKFVFYFSTPIKVQAVQLLADTIKGDANDQRVLSFPFKSLTIK